MSLSIRTAREEDAQGMIEILNPIIQTGTETMMSDPLSLSDQVRFIREFPKAGVFNVAVCDQSHQILGLQDILPVVSEVRSEVGEISTFVSINARRQGVGRQLTQVTRQIARDRGFTQINATIRAGNSQAICFYQDQGFRIRGIPQNYGFFRGQYIDVVRMEYVLSQGKTRVASI